MEYNIVFCNRDSIQRKKGIVNCLQDVKLSWQRTKLVAFSCPNDTLTLT
jgi:hypothetical protein